MPLSLLMRWLVSADFEIPYGVLREEVAVTLRNRIGVTSFEFRFEFHFGSELSKNLMVRSNIMRMFSHVRWSGASSEGTYSGGFPLR